MPPAPPTVSIYIHANVKRWYLVLYPQQVGCNLTHLKVLWDFVMLHAGSQFVIYMYINSKLWRLLHSKCSGKRALH